MAFASGRTDLLKRRDSKIATEPAPTKLYPDHSMQVTACSGSETDVVELQKDISLVPDAPEKVRQASEKKAEQAMTNKERLAEFLTCYRIMHIAILSLNAVIIVVAVLNDQLRHNLDLVALIQILCSLLVRSELFLFLLYNLVLIVIRPWAPLFLRRGAADVLLHIGGLHSGFAVGAVICLIGSFVEASINFRSHHTSLLVIDGLLTLLLVLVSLSPIPKFRDVHHNAFERLHRFVGWSAVPLVWLSVLLHHFWNNELQRFQAKLNMESPQTLPALIITMTITLLIIAPWLTIRKVPVNTTILSKGICHIEFDQGFVPGYFGRISRNPFSENHAFGISSFGPKSGKHCMVIAAQGDFTRHLVEKPPRSLYTRTFKFIGLPYLCPMFSRGLFVVTGAAIGVALGLFLQSDLRKHWHILWIAAKIEDVYADTVIADINKKLKSLDPESRARFEERLTIHDTRVHGRPNMTQLVAEHVHMIRAEIVFITSNPAGTAEIMRGCRSQSIWARGPVWDS